MVSRVDRLRTHVEHPRRTSAGFSVTELLVTMMVAAILVGVAVPGYREVTRSVRARSATSELVYELVRARSEAIKRNADVVMTRNAAAWEAGWRIESAAGTPISRHNGVAGIRVTEAPALIRYAPNGRLALATPPSFEIDLADGTTGYTRCVRVDLSGMPFSTAGACP